MKTLRNIAIIAAIAAAVVALPGGGSAAELVWALLSIIFAGLVALMVGRLYRDRRLDFYTLDDRHRAILYGAIAVAVLAFAASSRLFATGIGTLVWIALVAACVWGVAFVYRAWKQY